MRRATYTSLFLLAITVAALGGGVAEAHSMPLANSRDYFFLVAKDYLLLGIEHIWSGLDHILFLLMLVLLQRSFKQVLKVVTAFTLAHSATLALAALGIITLPPAIVEPAIALTILVVAIRNLILIRRHHIDRNAAEGWLLAAGFGLVHGLGFAGALKAIGLPANNFVSGLLFFNVGVELGQIALLLVMFPLLLRVDKSKRRYLVLAAIAGLAAFQALIWCIERLIW